MLRPNVLIVRALLSACALLCLPLELYAQRQLLFVDVHQQPQATAPPLQVELARQSLILSAIYDFSAATRDGTLREPDPGKSENTIRILVQARTQHETLEMRLRPLDGAPRTEPLSLDVPRFANSNVEDLAELARLCAQRSEEWRKLLNDVGLHGEPLKISDHVALPEEIEKLLNLATISSQYDALRRLHAMIEADGLSPAARGGMIRAWSQLGQLTRTHNGNMEPAFFARALLAAELWRKVDNDGDAPRLHLAYAQALTGLHAAALRTLGDKPIADDAPAWVAMIEPTCRYQRSKLQTLAADSGAQGQWPAVSAVLVSEGGGSRSLILSLCRKGLELQPNCSRLLDTASLNAGVGPMHEYTTVWFDRMVDDLRALLASQEQSFPADIREVRERARKNNDLIAGVASLSKAMVATNDRSEPSWAMYGRLVQEQCHFHVFRRVLFVARSLAADATEDVRVYAPLVEDHPMRGEVYRVAGMKDPLADKKPDADNSALAANILAMAVGVHGTDATAWELERAVRMGSVGRGNQETARALQFVSPSSTLALVMRIRHQWGAVKDQIPAWREQFTDEPELLKEIATQYMSRRQWAESSDVLKDYLAIAPDFWGHSALARVYENKGDKEAAIAAMKGALTLPDNGLEHGRANEYIAKLYMSERRYDEALPFAEGAGMTGSHWGMKIYAACLNAVNRHEEADEQINWIAQRYGNSAYTVYSWRVITQRGNIEEARTAMRSALVDAENSKNPEQLRQASQFHLVEEDDSAAITYLEAEWSVFKDPWIMLQLGMVHRRNGDPTAAVAALDKLFVPRARFDPDETLLLPMAQKFRDLWQAKQAVNPDDPFWQEVLAESSANPQTHRSRVNYFLAQAIAIDGDAAGAKARYDLAIADAESGSRTLLLATAFKRQLEKK